jgi:hypothetical protein
MNFHWMDVTCDWPTSHSCETGGDTFYVTYPIVTTTMVSYIPQSTMNMSYSLPNMQFTIYLYYIYLLVRIYVYISIVIFYS